MLDETTKSQLVELFAPLEANYTFNIAVEPTHAVRDELVELLQEVASCSERLSCHISEAEGLCFALLKEGLDTGIHFRTVPGGHEFSSLLLAILNADGKGRNLPDEAIQQRIAALPSPLKLTSYITLSCTNCPDVVQALNVITLLHPTITHEIVSSMDPDAMEERNIQAVPTIYANNTLLHVGRATLGELLQKLEELLGSAHTPHEVLRQYDALVVGAGPSGATAAIYLARKGLRVALIAQRVGGQVNETSAIENFISLPQTTGKGLARDIGEHIAHYDIELFENRQMTHASLHEGVKELRTDGGEMFQAPYLLIASGAEWRKLGIEGEGNYLGRGVAFCTHCDAPFYKGKRVAVIGGGNSGLEAAIDLAALAKEVVLVEFTESLNGDGVLQERIASLNHVTVRTHTVAEAIIGDGERVTALVLRERDAKQGKQIAIDGIFVQVGMRPNSALFAELVELSEKGEIVVDTACRTSTRGIYAAGDVTTVPFKQIVIAMGEGAKAALALFEDYTRGIS